MSSPNNELNQYLNRLSDEDEREERIDRLAELYEKDPKMVAEADTWLSGALPKHFYEGIESLFADIGDKGVMPEYVDKILVLADIASKARAEKIRWLAERDV